MTTNTARLAASAQQSPSLRAPSTEPDNDTDSHRASSPSTAYTSVHDSDDPEAAPEPFAANATRPLGNQRSKRSVVTREGLPMASRHLPEPSTSTRTWRMPFGKGSATPRPSAPPSQTVATMASASGLASPSQHPGHSAFNTGIGAHTHSRDNLDDGSFVETTSAQAAHALAQYWNDVQAQESTNGKGKGRQSQDRDYVVVARVENGKKIYRIRPRSRPTTATPRKGAEEKAISPAKPTRTTIPSIRFTRSIPNLRSNPNNGALSAIHRDQDGYYRPAGHADSAEKALLAIPFGQSHHLLPNNARDVRARTTTIHTAVSIPNLRAHRDNDVFGKLLGWSYYTPPVSRNGSPQQPSTSIVQDSPTTALQQEGAKGGDNTAAPNGDVHAGASARLLSAVELPPEMRTPVNDRFPDISGISFATSQPDPTCTPAEGSQRPTVSPFGQGVRLPSSPRLRRRKSMQQLYIQVSPSTDEPENAAPPDQAARPALPRSLREVSSSETIRTANAQNRMDGSTKAAKNDSPRTPIGPQAQQVDWTLDTRLFDTIQQDVTGDSLKPSVADWRQHQRGPSNASLVSLTPSMHSTSSGTSTGDRAHDITVTTVPGDDPRLVIWGLRVMPQLRQAKKLSTMSSSSGNLDSPPSLTSSSATSLNSSKRGSAGQRRSTFSDGSPVHSTPPSSATSPLATSVPTKKVLMAATVDRWVADMTSRIEGDLMTDFFLTYRAFLSSLALCKLLMTRFEWALQPGHTAEDIAGKRIVRVRTYVVIRHWLLNYFHEDFVPNRELRLELTCWLNRMGKDERLRATSTDLRLIKSLKKVVKRLKLAYSTIGVEEAADANDLIAGSQESLGRRKRSAGRSRADSAASTSSLHSIREEATEPLDPLSTERTAAGGTATVSSLRSGPDPAVFSHPTRSDVRTSSSEDDVDLEIDIHAHASDSDEAPRFPQTIPISPPRPRHYSPSTARKSRSPQISSLERSPQMMHSMPMIGDSNRFSKLLTSTVGSFSKWRRLANKRGEHSPYRHDLVESAGNHGPVSESGQPRGITFRNSLSPSLGAEQLGQNGLGIHGLSRGEDLPAPVQGQLRHASSTGTMRRLSSRGTSSPPGVTPSELGQTSSSLSIGALAPAADISGPGIQLDDYDSSGDESMNGQFAAPKRTLRRLPAARDLRIGQPFHHPHLKQRHSIDTISSYGTRRTPSCAMRSVRIPSVATYDADNARFAHDDVAIADQGMVPYFVLPVDSDSEEEVGDVEAALRRLEGQIDQDQQRNKARKVEQYLKRSEEARLNGGYQYEGSDEEAEVSVASAVPSETHAVEYHASQPVAEHLEATAAVAPALEESAPSDSASTPLPVASLQVPGTSTDAAGNLTNPKTLQRKSSMRRFFTNSLKPGSLKILQSQNREAAEVPKPSRTPSHRSVLLSYKTEVLARHFCIIERDLLEKVTWQELIGASWKDRFDLEDFTDWNSFMKVRAKNNAAVQDLANNGFEEGSIGKKIGDVQTIVQRFNLMCKWVASEIVLSTQIAERALIIGKVIKLAFKSYQMYNFQTVTQLIHALQLPPIERLAKTWSRVPAFEMRLFSQLKFFTSPLRDFRLLREATETLASQWGPPGQESRELDMTLPGVPGALPFFGLVLRDLAVSSELPTYLDPSSPRAPAVIDTETLLLPAYSDPQAFADLDPLPEGLPLRPLINVHKYRTIATTIQQVMTFKELASTYPYEPELGIYRQCLTLQCLPMSTVTQLSHACEK